MKYADFKLMVVLDEAEKALSLFAKKKNGLWFAQSDRNYTHVDGGGMQVFLGGVFALLTVTTNDKGVRYATLTIPSKENEQIRFKVESDEYEIDNFLETDYHGNRIG